MRLLVITTIGLYPLSGNTFVNSWRLKFWCPLPSTHKLMVKQKGCTEAWHKYSEHYCSSNNQNFGLTNCHMWNLQSTLIQMQLPRNLHLNYCIEKLLLSPLTWQLVLTPHTHNQLTLQPKFRILYIKYNIKLQSPKSYKNSSMISNMDIWSLTLTTKSCYTPEIFHYYTASASLRQDA